MVDTLHRVGVRNATPEKVFDALTTVDWNLRQTGGYTIVLFEHQGSKQPVEFMHHCSTKWGSFLMSLKSLVENDDGAPAPRDVRISDRH